jgi:septum formation protein
MTPADRPKPLILASASPIRLELLRRAGIDAIAVPADIDEAALKQQLRRDLVSTESGALALATAKAMRVAALNPGRIVIGADQILEQDGVWHDKPSGLEAAAAQLRTLAGRPHRLVTAVAAGLGTECLWSAADSARLVMRPFGHDFIDAYLAAAGPGILGSVGGYQLEGLGAQLFERVEGDFFTILGLPLLPLLGFLRRQRILPT